MQRVLFMCADAAVAAVLLIPLLALLNHQYFHDRKRTLWYCLFAIYLSGVFAVVGLPDIRYIRFGLNINLKPFAYMFSDYSSSILNIVLFVPLGFFLPVLWKAFGKLHQAVLFGFCMSLLIEVLQIFTYRATDINDLITNTLGTLLGWCVGRLAVRFLPGIKPGDKTVHLCIVCAAAFAVMFFLQPFLADFLFPFL